MNQDVENQAGGYIADRVADLEAELLEQCRLNGAGSEREAKQLTEITELREAVSELKEASMSNDTQREAFETDMKSCGLGYALENYDALQDEYTNTATQYRWEGWQAALASLPTMTEGELSSALLNALEEDKAAHDAACFKHNLTIPYEVGAEQKADIQARALIARLPHIVRSE